MKMLIAALLLTMSMVAHAEKTVCSGTWSHGQRAHVVINWGGEGFATATIDGIVLRVAGANVLGNGVVTTSHLNKFQYPVNYAIFHNSGYPVTIARYYSDNSNSGWTDAAYIYCSQSFDKPFSKRMR